MKLAMMAVLSLALGLMGGVAIGQGMGDGDSNSDTMMKKKDKTLNATVVGDKKEGQMVNEEFSQAVCKNSGLTRKVTIQYEDPNAKVPCKVLYEKPTEDAPTQTLWTAAGEEGFCEQKTQEFLDKLKGWGWDCSTN